MVESGGRFPQVVGFTAGIRARGARRLRREIERARRRLVTATSILPGRRSIKYRGSVLPPPAMRQNMCGPQYSSNRFFLESGRAEARRLVSKLGYQKGMHVVEIGSGVGRLATGLLREAGDVEYRGFDPVAEWVDWCKQYIEGTHPSFRFSHIDVENENYNPDGATGGGEFVFPLPDGQADIVYMWGVFTNMRLADARHYVAEISRMTRDGGRVFLTAFVEEDVPEETVNPADYVIYPCTSPLHVVRYSKQALFSIFEEHALGVEEFAHHGGSHCNQSEITLRKVGGP